MALALALAVPVPVPVLMAVAVTRYTHDWHLGFPARSAEKTECCVCGGRTEWSLADARLVDRSEVEFELMGKASIIAVGIFDDDLRRPV